MRKPVLFGRKQDPQQMAEWVRALYFWAACLKIGMTVEGGFDALCAVAPNDMKQLIQRRLGSVAASVSFEQRVQAVLCEPYLQNACSLIFLSNKTGSQTAIFLEQAAQFIQKKAEGIQRLDALTAQSRLTAWVVALCPFGVLLLTGILHPSVVWPFWGSSTGLLVLVGVSLWDALGFWVIHRMVNHDDI